MTDTFCLSADDWDVATLRSHIGREVSVSDRVTARVAHTLCDVIGTNRTADDDRAPLGIHWCLAPPDVPLEGLQEDGHPQAARTILPPVPSARRMWAGGEVVLQDVLKIGDEVLRRSVVADVTIKDGRSGTLCFVTVRHDYSTRRGPAISERQDIVYKRIVASGSPGAAPMPSAAAPVGRPLHRLKIDPIRLFRYSALSGNAHRIHYDEPYATGVENYRALVVHGPLQATLLMQAAAVPSGRTLARFAYRAASPMFCGDDLIVSCSEASPETALWTGDADGRVGMHAEIAWSPA